MPASSATPASDPRPGQRAKKPDRLISVFSLTESEHAIIDAVKADDRLSSRSAALRRLIHDGQMLRDICALIASRDEASDLGH